MLDLVLSLSSNFKLFFDISLMSAMAFMLVLFRVIVISVLLISKIAYANQGTIYTSNDLIWMLSDSYFVKNHLSEFKGKSKTSYQGRYESSDGYIVSSLNAKSIRTTIGTSILNMIHIRAEDKNGDPVSGAVVEVEVESGLRLVPGWLNGAMLTEMKTNNNGEFAGMLIADYNAIERKVDERVDDDAPEVNGSYLKNQIYGSSGVEPTIDEFGNRITGARPYRLIINVLNMSLKYNVDVDMGPAIVMSGTSAKLNSAQWVGKVTDAPVQMKLIYYQRTDACMNGSKKISAKYDDDNGEWTDEGFSLGNVKRLEIFNIQHKAVVDRYDGNKSFAKLVNARKDEESSTRLTHNVKSKSLDNDTMSNGGSLDIGSALPMSHYVVMDKAKGLIKVAYRVYNVALRYDRNLCISGSYVKQLPAGKVLTNVISDEISNTLALRAASPKVTIVVEDYRPVEPDVDPLPGIKGYSGLNLNKLSISLNEKVIFGKAIEGLSTNSYPNYIEVIADGENILLLGDEFFNEVSPGELEVSYYPSLDELRIKGSNLVRATGIEDRVGNRSPDITATFITP